MIAKHSHRSTGRFMVHPAEVFANDLGEAVNTAPTESHRRGKNHRLNSIRSSGFEHVKRPIDVHSKDRGIADRWVMGTMPSRQVNDGIATDHRILDIDDRSRVAPYELQIWQRVTDGRTHVAASNAKASIDKLPTNNLARISRRAGNQNLLGSAHKVSARGKSSVPLTITYSLACRTSVSSKTQGSLAIKP